MSSSSSSAGKKKARQKKKSKKKNTKKGKEKVVIEKENDDDVFAPNLGSITQGAGISQEEVKVVAQTALGRPREEAEAAKVAVEQEKRQEKKDSVRGDFLTCDNCGKESDHLSRCSKCMSVAYCSKECQRADWKAGHKSSCHAVCRRCLEPYSSNPCTVSHPIHLRIDMGSTYGIPIPGFEGPGE